MNVIRLAAKEFFGMFVDDGNLALPPLLGGALLLVGCLAILLQSVRRAARCRSTIGSR